MCAAPVNRHSLGKEGIDDFLRDISLRVCQAVLHDQGELVGAEFIHGIVVHVHLIAVGGPVRVIFGNTKTKNNRCTQRKNIKANQGQENNVGAKKASWYNQHKKAMQQ